MKFIYILKVLYFSFKDFMPPFLIKKIRVWQNKKDVKKKNLLKIDALKKYSLIDSDELYAHLAAKVNFGPAPLVFVQISLNDLYTFNGTALNIIQLLTKLVGPSGTLFLPAYTDNINNPFYPHIFDVLKDRTNTGMVTELFRRSKGVVRSLHPRHSICGRGPLAEIILGGHEKCKYADGLDSPFDKLRKYDDAWILNLGLPYAYSTFFHWQDEFEPNKLPYKVHKAKPDKRLVKDANGKILEVLDYTKFSRYMASLDSSKLAEYLSEKAMLYWEFNGMTFSLYNFKLMAKELLELRDKGMLIYKN